MKIRDFASDNSAGVHPEILAAITRANQDYAVAYGDDAYTERAVKKFKEHLGAKAEVFFVFNGTAANVLSLTGVMKPYHGVICSEGSHLNVNECGAPEKFIGCKLLDVVPEKGKLTLGSYQKALS